MGSAKKEKNKAEGQFEAGGNIDIGDKKVINVYGMETNEGDIKFFAKVFGGLAILFSIGALLFLIIPSRAQLWPNDFVASFFCGAFFALCLLFVIFLYRTKNKPINVN